MPQIAIKNFEVSTDGVDNSELRILIEYVITPLGTTDILDLPISNSSISPVSTSGVSVSSNSSISSGLVY